MDEWSTDTPVLLTFDTRCAAADFLPKNNRAGFFALLYMMIDLTRNIWYNIH